ncbi:cobalt-precorrin-6A reductase [Pseudooceanicola sp.]|uniref:cobalt-precorrin-6A reductase n=1 Tax=Pseudooceanicola sp. TaxID=1914328 RepID=UPI002617D439|nr:cobalt-precorrin-6A reductase [Pseudooceanicola sp.]MDF1854327.1 cobalt-precorrin-6A reductase [Pseudooceanicola sp.]
MILLLAGTAEARHVARALASAGVPAIASLAGAVRGPAELAVPTRIGGFGGAAGFRRFLVDQGIAAVLDATHPFAARITARTALVCDELGLPYLRVQRPAWQAGPGDVWHEVAQPEEVPGLIPAKAHLFLAVGRQQLARYAGLAGRQIVARSIEPVASDFPWPGGRFLTGRPPFSVADEIALFRRLGTEWLVTKNAGGSGAAAKLEAARALALPVAMIVRPLPPEGVEIVETVDAALDWALAL